MTKYDLIIRNGNIYGGGMFLQKNTDMAIRDGRIVKVDKCIEGFTDMELDASGKLVSPGFIDSCACIDNTAQADGISGASHVIDMYIANGTTVIKNLVQVNERFDMEAFRSLVDLKEQYRDKADIYNVVSYLPAVDSIWREAAELGMIDFVGGNITSKSEVDTVFALAKEYGLPIDVRCGESDIPDISIFLYIIEKTMKEEYQRRVTCGHVTALYADGMNEDLIMDAAARCARAHVNVTSPTSRNLYMTDWRYRGTTRVRELSNAGVNVSVSSDNIQDSIRPFGNASMLEEALLTAQVHKFATHAELSGLYEMITYNPALSAQLEDYGTFRGCRADLVIVDAPDTTEAILSRTGISHVLKNGRLVAKDGEVL